jgi:Uma2 family endonuclease
MAAVDMALAGGPAETEDAGKAIVPSQYPGVSHRKFSVVEYHLLADLGILAADEPVQLIEGEILTMAPAGSAHSGTINRLNRMLVQAVGTRAVVAPQNPVRVGKYSEPEPDFTLLRPRPDDYLHATPNPEDVLLMIEVSSSTLKFDQTVKRTLYARHNVPEYWIVNVKNHEIEVYHTPIAGQYTVISRACGDVSIEPTTLPGVVISISLLFG